MDIVARVPHSRVSCWQLALPLSLRVVVRLIPNDHHAIRRHEQQVAAQFGARMLREFDGELVPNLHWWLTTASTTVHICTAHPRRRRRRSTAAPLAPPHLHTSAPNNVSSRIPVSLAPPHQLSRQGARVGCFMPSASRTVPRCTANGIFGLHGAMCRSRLSSSRWARRDRSARRLFARQRELDALRFLALNPVYSTFALLQLGPEPTPNNVVAAAMICYEYCNVFVGRVPPRSFQLFLEALVPFATPAAWLAARRLTTRLGAWLLPPHPSPNFPTAWLLDGSPPPAPLRPSRPCPRQYYIRPGRPPPSASPPLRVGPTRQPADAPSTSEWASLAVRCRWWSARLAVSRQLRWVHMQAVWTTWMASQPSATPLSPPPPSPLNPDAPTFVPRPPPPFVPRPLPPLSPLLPPFPPPLPVVVRVVPPPCHPHRSRPALGRATTTRSTYPSPTVPLRHPRPPLLLQSPPGRLPLSPTPLPPSELVSLLTLSCAHQRPLRPQLSLARWMLLSWPSRPS